MKHDITSVGAGYRLRPVTLDDAQFIIDARLEDGNRNKYIHEVSDDISIQVIWLNEYFERRDDYYFVIDNRLTGQPEGLIGLYDIRDGKGEWGRWVLRKGSLAAVESVDLIFKVALEVLCLEELCCRTIVNNQSVVSFHDSLPQLRRGIIKSYVELRGEYYDVVEHYVTLQHYKENLQGVLKSKATAIFQRNLRLQLGKLEFHHIGVATNGIESEADVFGMLGYVREDTVFEDPQQGVRGVFMKAEGLPRLELLENLPGSSTLNVWINSGIKMYHFAFRIDNIIEAQDVLNRNRIKTISPLKMSTYFGSRICFLLLPNRYLIELIEKKI
jgi:RimJ/RimL family protein N-acetyltransferase